MLDFLIMGLIHVLYFELLFGNYMKKNCFWTLVFVLGLPSAAVSQLGALEGEWPTYGGDLGHTRYSGLDQIDSSNFSELEIAWTFDAANFFV